ncbi:hypothetical protein ACLSU7_02535 [Bdellovibrio sp. HCB185ZH]|uniref:hypothetical protein n=1 Tax=Bdellovibrio sp. HCB185ZH TaxID=3394235 RepID=UPI0039A60574
MFNSVYVILAILLIHSIGFAGTPPQALTFDESIRKLSFLIGDNMSRKHGGGIYDNQLELREAAVTGIEKVPLIDNESHSRIVSSYGSDGLTIRLQYDETVEKKPELLFKNLLLYTRLTHFDLGADIRVTDREFDKMFFESPHTWAELQFNSEKGSLAARARLAHIENDLLKSSYAQPTAEFLEQISKTSGRVQRVLPTLIQESTKETQELDQLALKSERLQKKSTDTWRNQTQTLEQWESQADKLNDLILKNDRQAVAQMISDFLPWASMTPSESSAWSLWLEAIRHPDLTKSTVAFRGVDYATDKIQRVKMPDGETRVAFMSTLLTKNQGSYTRRLRSLSVNRLQNGDLAFEKYKTGASVIGISDQMTNHAREPKSSSFLSFTYDPWVATKFVGKKKIVDEKGQMKHTPNGGTLAVRIDSRRLFPNIMSEYPGEIELLAPLVIFPDEVVEYKEGPFMGQINNDTMEVFLAKVAQKTNTNVTIWTDRAAKKSVFKFYFKRDGYKFMENFLPNNPISAPLCSRIFK